MAMSDKEVRAQLERMVQFIKKEAEEKAQEIRDKAHEEFSIEKQRLVQAEKLKILKEYERKEKQVEVQRKIAYSSAINASRLKVLEARKDAVKQIYADAQRRLAELSQGEKYKDLLRLLILQAALKLKEPEVSVRVRQVDRELAQSQFAAVEKEYKEKTGERLKLVLDTVSLPPPPGPGVAGETCAGGAVLSAHEGRILCNNTLDERLALAFEQRLPEVRIALFGRSSTRKFTT